MKFVYFDMDGTIADLYGFKNWLEYLIKEDTTPYMEAKPLMNLSALAREIHRGQKLGIKYGIISWTSKGGTPAYNKAVEEVKKAWLRKHLPSVVFDEIHVIEYGKSKSFFAKGTSYLFDDEEKNRKEWTGRAFDVNNILQDLKAIRNGV